MNYKFCTVFAFVLFLASIGGFYLLIHYSQNNYDSCVIVNFTSNKCRAVIDHPVKQPERTILYIDQFYQLDKNRTGIYICAKADTCYSYCDVNVGDTFRCVKGYMDVYDLNFVPNELTIAAIVVVGCTIFFVGMLSMLICKLLEKSDDYETIV
jgi:hypothetical protein